MSDQVVPAVPVPSAETIARAQDGLIFSRWAATFLDTVVFLALYITVGVISQGRGGWPLPTLGLAAFAYYVILEGRWGVTLGKLAVKIRVVDGSGAPPGYGRAAIRTLLRLVEVNPMLAGGFPAAIAVWLSKKHQRIGDMLAGTYVLRVEDVKRLRHVVDVSVF
jgi:uncharacterized RDD family membrane protein YckC